MARLSQLTHGWHDGAPVRPGNVKPLNTAILALGVLFLGILLPRTDAWSQAVPLKPGAPLPRPVEPPAATTAAWQLEWKDLLPPGERDKATLSPPAPLHDYLLGEDGPAATQPMNFSVNEALDGRLVRIPGFIVPLDIDEEGRVTEMFLVPFFGACIHVPPPPPNQIVHVTLAKPLPLDAMDAAFWITGRLAVAKRKTRLGTSAYSVKDATSEEYRF